VKIYLSLISLDAMLTSRRLTLADSPALAADHGFEGVEILDRQISGLDDDGLGKFHQICRRFGCGVVVDAGCDLTVPGQEAVERELSHLRRVIDQASILGCTTVRLAIGGQRLSIQKLNRRNRPSGPAGGKYKRTVMSSAWVRRAGYLYRSRWANHAKYAEPVFRSAIEALCRILPYAGERGISLAIENHWGISSRPEWIMRILKGVDAANIGTCPDFGNFASRADRYAGIAMLAPAALHVQAKCWSFRSDGEERTIDFGRCMGILKDAGYDGTVAVEYEGGGDELSACINARQLILRSL